MIKGNTTVKKTIEVDKDVFDTLLESIANIPDYIPDEQWMSDNCQKEVKTILSCLQYFIEEVSN